MTRLKVTYSTRSFDENIGKTDHGHVVDCAVVAIKKIEGKEHLVTLQLRMCSDGSNAMDIFVPVGLPVRVISCSKEFMK